MKILVSVFLFASVVSSAAEHTVYADQDQMRLRLSAGFIKCGFDTPLSLALEKTLPVALSGSIHPSAVNLSTENQDWLEVENLSLRLGPGSHLRFESVGFATFLIRLHLSFGVTRPRRPDHMRRFPSSGELERCFFRVLDEPVVPTSDYAHDLFWKILRRFTMVQASIDQGVPRARVAELLAEAQVFGMHP